MTLAESTASVEHSVEFVLLAVVNAVIAFGLDGDISLLDGNGAEILCDLVVSRNVVIRSVKYFE